MHLNYSSDFGETWLSESISFEPEGGVLNIAIACDNSGAAPLTVNFTDLSTGNVTSWLWDFGHGRWHFDGGGCLRPGRFSWRAYISTEQNPTHTYRYPGTYTVKLTVTGPGGSDSETKTGHIIVTSP